MDQDKLKLLKLYSDYEMAKENASIYLGPDTKLLPSTRPTKKFMVRDPNTGKYVHFGQMGYEDFTKTRDMNKRYKYLRRAQHIKGEWYKNEYSPNNLSIHILWQ